MANSGSGSNRLTGATSDDLAVLDFATPPDGFRRRTRTLKSGKVQNRITIEIESEPILFDFSERRLGKGPAEAILAEIQADFAKITEVASAATLAKRKAAAAALDRGARWAKERYAGGRTGEKRPTGSVRKLIDSGRLKDGMVVRENRSDESWTINVPANRFDERDFDAGSFQRLLEDVRRLLPAMSARELLKRPKFREALDDAVGDLVQKAFDRNRALKRENLRAFGGLVSQLGRLVLP